jgi:hypothetical protein
MSVLPKLLYRFNEIPIIIPTSYSMDKQIPKLIKKDKRPRITNTVFKGRLGKLMLSNFKKYYKATVIKTVWY